MPCCSCTTGSPMRSSERSRSIASTFERRAGVARAAAHDAGVELGLGDERELRLRPREAGGERRDGQRERARRRATNAREVVDERHGCSPYSAKYCCIVSRRPGALGADQHARVAGGEKALQRGERIVGAAVDRDRRQRRGAARRRRRRLGCRRGNSMRAMRLQRAVERVGGRNSSVGGSSGRALSPRSSL